MTKKDDDLIGNTCTMSAINTINSIKRSNSWGNESSEEMRDGESGGKGALRFGLPALILLSIVCFLLATKEMLQPGSTTGRRRLTGMLDPKTVEYKSTPYSPTEFSTSSVPASDVGSSAGGALEPVPIVDVSSDYHADGSKYPDPSVSTSAQASSSVATQQVPLQPNEAQAKAMMSGGKQQMFQSIGRDAAAEQNMATNTKVDSSLMGSVAVSQAEIFCMY